MRKVTTTKAVKLQLLEDWDRRRKKRIRETMPAELRFILRVASAKLGVAGPELRNIAIMLFIDEMGLWPKDISPAPYLLPLYKMWDPDLKRRMTWNRLIYMQMREDEDRTHTTLLRHYRRMQKRLAEFHAKLGELSWLREELTKWNFSNGKAGVPDKYRNGKRIDKAPEIEEEVERARKLLKSPQKKSDLHPPTSRRAWMNKYKQKAE